MKTFIISTDSPEIIYLKKKDRRLALLIDHIGDIECHVHEDDFSFVVCEILGQMLSNKVADVICDRLYKICDGEINAEKIIALGYEELRAIGTSNAKANCILEFSEKVISGEVSFEKIKTSTEEEVYKILTATKGIGAWTAKMYLLFVLGCQDVLPYEDGAFVQTYKWIYEIKEVKPKDIVKKCRKWSPYSSLGARYFYRALDMGITRIPFKQFKMNHFNVNR